MKIFSLIGLMLLVSATALAKVPATLSFDEHELVLNGAAVQKKLVFDVYEIALYLEAPKRDAQAAIDSDEAKALRFTMLRDAKAGDVAGALREGFAKTNARLEPLRARLETMLGAIPDMKAGDTILMTYRPGVGTVLKGKDHSVRIAGKDFSDGLMRVWIGDDPGTAKIKKRLLNQ